MPSASVIVERETEKKTSEATHTVIALLADKIIVRFCCVSCDRIAIRNSQLAGVK